MVEISSYQQIRMDVENIEALRCILYELLKTYPNGLDNRGWDVKGLSLNPYLPPSYISENPDLPWDWYCVSSFIIITDNFIEEFESHINWNGLSCNHSLTEELIERYWSKLNHFYLSYNRALSSRLINKYGGTAEDMLSHKSPFDPYHLLADNDLSIDIIDKYADVWGTIYTSEDCDLWMMITEDPYIPITLEFVKKHKKKLTWRYLSSNRYMNVEILEFMISNPPSWFPDHNGVKMKKISRTLPFLETKDAEEIIATYGDQLDTTLYDLQSKLMKLSDEDTIQYIIDNKLNYVGWIKLCENLSLDIEYAKLVFIKVPNWDRLNVDWNKLSDTDNIDMFTLEQYIDNWNYDNLSLHAPVEFITSHPELSWNSKNLSRRKYNPSISYLKSKSARSK